MDLTADYFSLFQLPRSFKIDMTELDARYRNVQAEVHPDRFAAASEAEKRLSMQWATQANEAYRTLKKPLERAKYLLHLAGHDVQADKNTAMPAEFLMEQMEWREAVADARAGGDHHELEQLLERLNTDLAAHYGELAALIDDVADWPKAAEAVRRLMFMERLLSEIEDALVALEE
ncbi:MAG: hypothetical protein BWY57_02355 [Betaproteobacteria bacterium ADurb.Bin341]|nr:MAG: hypothetical protein BWY57_02355 [Betaproteobacteria bacterium ADurb.Bin341]